MLIKETDERLNKGIIIRAYMPLGFYTTGSFYCNEACLEIDKDFVFSAAQFKAVELEDYHIEREWLLPAEIRLLSSIALSVPDGFGKVIAYPCPQGFKINNNDYDLTDNRTLLNFKELLIDKLSSKENQFWNTVHLPPALGGSEYRFNENARDTERQKILYNEIDTNDHLLIRGLGAFLKGDLLSAHHIFHTEACISLHIAMEASLQIILRRLSNTMQNPSIEDASRYLGEAFQNKYVPIKYFEDYYEDRISTIHPSSRIGTFPDAPLAADDFYDLSEQLRGVFDFLITGNVREEFKGR